MANLIITNQCNIKCPFCFAVENNANENSNKDYFEIEDFWNIALFTKGKRFRLCGGEPTQNKNAVQAIKLLLKSNKNIFIMTNGIWHDNFVQFIQNLRPEESVKIGFLFNILEPSFYNEAQINKIQHVLSVINPKQATLGMTIYQKEFNYKYLIDFAIKFKIDRIRWSVVAPYIFRSEYKIHQDFPAIAKRITEFIKECNKRNLHTNNDCGYIPPCYFDKKDLLEIKLNSKNQIRFMCDSSPVDINEKGEAWRCYGLFSILREKIENFKNEDELRNYFDRRVRILNEIFPYKECETCNFKNSGCSGECYSIRINKIIEQNPDACIFPIDNEIEILNCKPYLSEKALLKSNNGENQLLMLNNVIQGIDENTLAFLSEIDGKQNIKDLINLWQKNFSSYEVAKSTIVNKTRELFEMDIIGIKYNYDYEPIDRYK